MSRSQPASATAKKEMISEELYAGLDKVCNSFLPQCYAFAESLVKVADVPREHAAGIEGMIITRFSEFVTIAKLSVLKAK